MDYSSESVSWTCATIRSYQTFVGYSKYQLEISDIQPDISSCSVQLKWFSLKFRSNWTEYFVRYTFVEFVSENLLTCTLRVEYFMAFLWKNILNSKNNINSYLYTYYMNMFIYIFELAVVSLKGRNTKIHPYRGPFIASDFWAATHWNELTELQKFSNEGNNA